MASTPASSPRSLAASECAPATAFAQIAASHTSHSHDLWLQVKEENLAIVVIDTLATWAQGWVSEERFAQKLQLSAKQVHRTLKALQRGGFIVLEERREKVNRDRVESVADYEEVRTRGHCAAAPPHTRVADSPAR